MEDVLGHRISGGIAFGTACHFLRRHHMPPKTKERQVMKPASRENFSILYIDVRLLVHQYPRLKRRHPHSVLCRHQGEPIRSNPSKSVSMEQKNLMATGPKDPTDSQC